MSTIQKRYKHSTLVNRDMNKRTTLFTIQKRYKHSNLVNIFCLSIEIEIKERHCLQYRKDTNIITLVNRDINKRTTLFTKQK